MCTYSHIGKKIPYLYKFYELSCDRAEVMRGVQYSRLSDVSFLAEKNLNASYFPNA